MNTFFKDLKKSLEEVIEIPELNRKTLKAIEEAEKGKGFTAHKDMKNLFKKLGIKK
jgi:antitoxin component of RelBE/YafQ-DinJ toxin-antitoxin module